MSKTDNTRPEEIQWADPTESGYVRHYHSRVGSRTKRITPEGYTVNYMVTLDCDESHCRRIAYHFGGEHSLRPRRNPKKAWPSRRMRRQVRQQLHRLPADPWRFDDHLPRTYRFNETIKGIIYWY